MPTTIPFRRRFRQRCTHFIRANLLPANFITIHYSYFVLTCLLSAVILWASSTPPRSVSFVDSLFLAVSAMTEAGLNTINLSTLNTFQQFILFVLIMLGSAIWVSAFVVQIRKRSFERKLVDVVKQRKARHHRHRSNSWHSLPFVRALSRDKDQELGEQLRSPTGRGDLVTVPDSKDFGLVTDHEESEEDKSRIEDRGRPRTPVEATNPPPSAGANLHSRDSHADGLSTSKDGTDGVSRITFSPDTYFRASMQDDDGLSRRRVRPRLSFVSLQGVGAHADAELHTVTSRTTTIISNDERTVSPHKSTQKYFPSRGFIGRNSQFHGLSEAERDRLGGVEYKALRWLSWLVPLYFVLWQLLSCLGIGAYIATKRPDTTRQNGLNPWWVGAFNAVSAFNNSGMSLLDANMTAFQSAYYMLITMGLLILAGNTCYPIFLRLIIWTLYKLMPDSARLREHRSTLKFLLDHPRRCYTNLFPSRHTWWLLLAVITLNGIDWAAFEILNIGNTALYSTLPIHLRVIDGLFQAFAVRSGGFYVVAIPTLRISLQVLYVVMMYISVYPVVITMRNSNVYEERSLGIYSDDPSYEQYGEEERNQRQSIWSKITGLKRRVTGIQDTKSYFVRQQIRAQLAHDAWWVVMAVFVVMIIEGGQFERNPISFSVFNVIFETVSAYGTVGISIGVPDNAYSFCGSWHTLSKLVLCAVMLRGRHRGLPVAIDKAVLLPGEKLGQAEEEDAMIRMERATSRGRGDDAA